MAWMLGWHGGRKPSSFGCWASGTRGLHLPQSDNELSISIDISAWYWQWFMLKALICEIQLCVRVFCMRQSQRLEGRWYLESFQ
ncbi:hypothetical protein ASPACDRAFT_121216 [Aspergillus aculeatus ATCC 16872]|uniref:Uncharacterized protein n=1 Tax=Aspergillus aculeatus (strain ATCC 16872 / CBS 172.66 / WB 5094) TaxID=690307 RepID=A0A1L9WRF5_ASPA1|nr:uncharacterized protein ASPACDRAFT_121216 [Aspergillus aculeatus ATCC 16872]OJJ98668.1 hypothetical protein ASPACDRAFT_121216 [Aspergillus aculeatus ATCC 16872]